MGKKKGIESLLSDSSRYFYEKAEKERIGEEERKRREYEMKQKAEREAERIKLEVGAIVRKAIREVEEETEKEKRIHERRLRNSRIKAQIKHTAKKAVKYACIGALCTGLLAGAGIAYGAFAPEVKSYFQTKALYEGQLEEYSRILEKEPANQIAYTKVADSLFYLNPEWKRSNDYIRRLAKGDEKNTQVLAAEKGIVEQTGRNDFFGSYVVIKFKGFFGREKQMFYGCLGDINVKPLQRVRRNWIIAMAGNKCKEAELLKKEYGIDGYYIHHDIRYKGIAENPVENKNGF